jgi:predicted Zn-dependent peptidase
MKFPFRSNLLAVLGLFFAAPLAASEAPSFDLPVIEKVLRNGLRVLVVERPGVPLVSFSFMQPVGAQDAPKGKTGLPHMLEHMMFKGTKTIGTTSFAKERPLLEAMDKVADDLNRERHKREPSEARLKGLEKRMKGLQEEHRKLLVKDELSAIYTRHGGQSLNAWTSQDATNYHITLPANKVALYAAVETDRLKDPVFREFYSERDVVAQERRWRYESQPRGKMFEALQSTAFTASPYREIGIGWMGDILKLTRRDAEAFYQATYRPDRGTLAVVGGVKAAEVLPILERTLGTVPNPPVEPLAQDWSQEPPQQGPRTAQVPFDADPQAMMGWHMPAFPHPDAVALDALSTILTKGNTSRLEKELVLKGKSATSVDSFTGFPGDRRPALFVLSFTPAPGRTYDEVVKEVERVLLDIQEKGVTQEELARAQRSSESSFLWGKASTEGLAQDLAYVQTVYGDWRLLERNLVLIRALTPKDLQEAAKKYLVTSNRSLVTLERQASK